MNQMLNYGVWAPKLHIPKIETKPKKHFPNDFLRVKTLKEENVIIFDMI